MRQERPGKRVTSTRRIHKIVRGRRNVSRLSVVVEQRTLGIQFQTMSA